MKVRHTSRKKSGKRVTGGSAGAGGVSFQAQVTAIAFVHLMAGTAPPWLGALATAAPVAVAAETGGPGDDIRITLHDAAIVEVQVKRGLNAGPDLWDPLLALAKGIEASTINFGLLIVSPDSSKTIWNELAIDITRIGDGRSDGLRELANVFLEKLKTAGLDSTKVCKALRIFVVHAMDSDNASISIAQAELKYWGIDPDQLESAWKFLCADALSLIERRGLRDASSILRLLDQNGLKLKSESTSPVSFIDELCAAVTRNNAEFSIFGIQKALPLDISWIPLSLVVRGDGEPPSGLEQALAQYHNWHTRDFGSNKDEIDPLSLTRFYPHCVVIAGPGMGKSTYLKKLARAFASERVPVLKANAPFVIARMRQGASFEEALWAHSLDGTGQVGEVVARDKVQNWLVLCDGLDECGSFQETFAEGLIGFLSRHPLARAVVATRPVGYTTSRLSAWRHYEVLPLARGSEAGHLEKLLTGLALGDKLIEDTLAFASAEMKRSKAGEVVTRSPLLLGLALSLSLRRIEFGASKSQLYEKLFDIIDDIPNTRKSEGEITPAVLSRFLDIVGWDLVLHPASQLKEILARCSKTLAVDLQLTPLQAAAESDRCSRYWQDVGMLECVQHAGNETLAFVHKTFSEFAAARFLVSQTQAELAEQIRLLLNNSAAAEVIGFSGAMGAAGTLCAELVQQIQSKADAARNIPKALRLLTETRNPPSKDLALQAIGLAIPLLSGNDAETIDAAAAALAEVAGSFKERIAHDIQALTTHEDARTRLAAWVVLIACGEEYSDFDDMVRAFQKIPSQIQAGAYPSLDGGLVLTKRSVDLLRQFAVAATRRILAHLPSTDAEQVLKQTYAARALQTLGLIDDAQRVIQEYGYNFSVADLTGLKWPKFNWDDAKYRRASTAFFLRMFEPLAGKGTETAQLDAPLYELSAFMCQTGFWNIASNDMWQWESTSQLEEEGAVIRAVAMTAGRNMQALSADSRAFSINAEREKSEPTFSVLKYAVHVDVAPIDWTRAKTLNLELAPIERALYHPSSWLTALAANLFFAAANQGELRLATSRLLANGSDLALWVAANFAEGIENGEGRDMIYERLRQPLGDGCEHLFDILCKAGAPLDQQMMDSLQHGLLSPIVDVAIGAANLAASVIKSGMIDLIPALERAYEYWLVHEKPYPKEGGSIPPSPREQITKALLQLNAVSETKLLEMGGDQRVGGAVASAIKEKLAADSKFLDQVINRISTEALPARLLVDVLRARTPLRPEQVLTIRTFLASAVAKLRFAGLGVLDEAYLPRDEILRLASALKKDTEPEIAERASRIMRELE
jgi:hypothetical protein